MVAKLKSQLAKRNRTLYGTSSERFDAAQASLIEAAPLEEAGSRKAANHPQIDRSLPAHLPREAHEHRPEATEAHHDVNGQPVAAARAAGVCVASARTSPNNWSTCRRASR